MGRRHKNGEKPKRLGKAKTFMIRTNTGHLFKMLEAGKTLYRYRHDGSLHRLSDADTQRIREVLIAPHEEAA